GPARYTTTSCGNPKVSCVFGIGTLLPHVASAVTIESAIARLPKLFPLFFRLKYKVSVCANNWFSIRPFFGFESLSGATGQLGSLLNSGTPAYISSPNTFACVPPGNILKILLPAPALTSVKRIYQ